MTNQELREQFQRCQEWNDPKQWEELAIQYYLRGFYINALYCFRMADEL